MKTRLTFLLTAIFCCSILFTSCHDDFSGANGGNSTMGETQKIVSSKVQTMKLQRSAYSGSEGGATMIYQDFNHQCIFALAAGNLRMVCKELTSGHYTNLNVCAEAGLKSVGKVDGIESITKTDVELHEGGRTVTNYDYYVFDQEVQPDHGYLAKFKTDNGDMYVRLFIKSYKFEGDTLSEITVEFQAF